MTIELIKLYLLMGLEIEKIDKERTEILTELKDLINSSANLSPREKTYYDDLLIKYKNK
jgi:uncharacterized protein YfkK (UPF0435 family)